MEKIITTQELIEKFGDNYFEAIGYILNYRKKYPVSIEKPCLKKNATSSEAKEYAEKLEQYERDFAEYKDNRRDVVNYNSNIESVLEEYLKEISGFYRIVPTQYQNKVWFKAWEMGHAYGYPDVYSALIGLIEIFE